MDERTALLIDGANMYATGKALGFQIDYQKLLEHLQRTHNVVRANYYTAVLEQMPGEVDPLIPVIDWLSFNGFKVVTKPSRGSAASVIKGNMDAEIIVDAMMMAPCIDHFIIGSGDGDFKALVHALQSMGKFVTAVSTTHTHPPMIASILRREVDRFIDIDELRPRIERTRA
jgi:uncharacterized LabA/DUF88 family protein